MTRKKAGKRSTKAETGRLVAYIVTGGAWFWSGYIMFAVLYGWLEWKIVPAKISAYIFGLVVNFLLERFWVFGDNHPQKELEKVTVRYVVLSVVNLAIDTGIVYGLSKAGITPYIGQFISAGFFTVWNYIWYKFWVFAKKVSPGPKRQAAPVLHRSKHVRYGVRRKK